MEFTVIDLLYDICLMSMLLVVGKVLRTRLKILQNLYIPSSLIAGILGIIMGEYFLNILPFSNSISSYSGVLIAILFASLCIGTSRKVSFKQMIQKTGDSFFLNAAAEIGMYGIGITAGYIILQPLFEGIQEAFGLMLPAGFVGGHGTAAAIGNVLEEVGWVEGTSIGQTFATIGLLSGVILGIIIINYGVKKGYTEVIKEITTLPQDMRTGLIKAEARESMGENTISPMSLDPLTWHIALVMMSVGGAYLLDTIITKIVPEISIPIYGLALICGVAVQGILRMLKLDSYTDKRVINRIGSSVTDYLVGFGIASININIVLEYWLPIVILCTVGLLFAITFLFFISRRFFRDCWFERGIYIFGWSTGVMSIGVILLRIVDPEFKTSVLEDSGYAWIFVSIIDLLLVTFIPILILQGFGFVTGIMLLVISAILILCCKKFIKN